MEDGWIEWNGGECPVAPEIMVEFRCRDGYEDTAEAGELATSQGCSWWDHATTRPSFNMEGDSRQDDIIAYRIAPQAVSAS